MNLNFRGELPLPVCIFKVIILLLASLVTSCATITRGTNEVFVITTDPPSAQVSSSSGWSCLTPCSMRVARRGAFVLTISKEGYKQVIANVESSADGAGGAAMAGNIIFGGLIGAGVDAGTGAMHSHKPNPLTVKLLPSP